MAVPAVVHAQAAPAKPSAATGGASGAKSGGVKPPAAGKAPAAASGEEGLRQVISAYDRAVAQGDLQAMAKFWTPDGDYVGPTGRATKARPALEAGDAKGAASHLVLETKSLRMVTPEVALEDGICELKSEGEKPIFRGNYSAVWVKLQGAWLLSSLRESLAPPPSHATRLSALDWLVGEWEAVDGTATITVKSDWSDTKMYLLREIVVEREDRVIHRITQRIAWDPLTKRIKGWTFDADGSVGESFWTKQGEDWIAQSTGVTRVGQITSAKNVYSGITADSFSLRSSDAQVGQESKPEFELHFKRVPADQ